MTPSFMRSTMWVAILLLATLAVLPGVATAEDRQAEGWRVVKPRSVMIQAEFELPKAEGDERDGRLTVVKAGGSVEANIQRWRHQFEELKEKPVEEIDVSGTKVTLVDFSGTYKGHGGMTRPVTKLSGYRMLGAIISKPDGLWFVKGYGPAKTMAQHSDAFRVWVESRAVLPSVVSKEDWPKAGVLNVRLRVLGGEARKPLAGLDVTVRSAGKEIHRTTEADGGASFELAPGHHAVSVTSPRALPYLRFDRMDYEYRRSKWRSVHLNDNPNEQMIDLVLADPCELVFRAVDVDTGEGIAGFGFAMENPAGEVWADPILNDTINPEGERAQVDSEEESELTNEQGYFRRLRGPWHEKWTYFVNESPDGYYRASRTQVKIDTSLGKKRAEHTFLFRRTDGGALSDEVGKARIERMFKVTPPEGWRVVNSKSRDIWAKFELPKAEGDERDGRLIMVPWGGRSDIQRWRGQFEELKEKPVEEIDVSGTKITLVDFSGMYRERQVGGGPVDRRLGYRMLGAILSKPDGRWFVKGYGPKNTMARHQEAFRAFVEALAAAGGEE